jgi:hypothetical protein
MAGTCGYCGEYQENKSNKYLIFISFTSLVIGAIKIKQFIIKQHLNKENLVIDDLDLKTYSLGTQTEQETEEYLLVHSEG